MYYVYILSNWDNSVLYIGVTSDLKRRLYEHRNHLVDGFTARYNVHKLVYFEYTNDVRSAGGYENTTRLHPKKRVYGFPESHDNSGQYASYGSKKKIVDTKGKPIYKNAESSEGGFIEY